MAEGFSFKQLLKDVAPFNTNHSERSHKIRQEAGALGMGLGSMLLLELMMPGAGAVALAAGVGGYAAFKKGEKGGSSKPGKA